MRAANEITQSQLMRFFGAAGNHVNDLGHFAEVWERGIHETAPDRAERQGFLNAHAPVAQRAAPHAPTPPSGQSPAPAAPDPAPASAAPAPAAPPPQPDTSTVDAELATQRGLLHQQEAAGDPGAVGTRATIESFEAKKQRILGGSGE